VGEKKREQEEKRIVFVLRARADARREKRRVRRERSKPGRKRGETFALYLGNVIGS